MKYKVIYFLLAVLSLTLYCTQSAKKTAAIIDNPNTQQEITLKTHPVRDTNPDWRLAVQLWSFHKYTFFEAIEKADSLGISWIEAYPGQLLGKEFPDIKFGHEMPLKYRIEVKKRLLEKGLRIVNYGVVGLSKDENASRKVFDFAKDMGIETIASEPPDDSWDVIERLCEEYKINAAIHNHPTPSHYWNPDKVAETIKGRSNYIGACADIGHWLRSGVNPIEALKKLEGRVKSLHFKDLNKAGIKEAHDVPWGTGASNLTAVLKELKRQEFKGVFSIEYEHNWTSSMPEIYQCVKFFEKQAGEIKSIVWKDLLAQDLSNCVFKDGSWTYKQGLLSAIGGGDIWTKDRYGDFILDLEFKLDNETNSGIFVRTGSIKEWLHTAIEVQILDSFGKEEPNKHDCGAIFDCLEPKINAVKKPGEWNRYTITCRANKINVLLNGQAVIDMDLDKWQEAHKNPDGTPNKFNTAYQDMSREGHIGLQYHGHPVWFRNIKIREL